MSERLDLLDYRLLDEFQRSLPLEQRPFAIIGQSLSITEAEVINRFAALAAQGYISRIGATIRPNTAGASTLAAMAVPQGDVEKVAAVVSAEAGVNHSYLREDEWNLWFVATAPNPDELQAMLDRLSARTGHRILDLRLRQPFNIDLGFSLTGRNIPRPDCLLPRPEAIRSEHRPLLQLVASGMPLVARPYAAMAAELSCHEEEVIGHLGDLIAAGIITRLGVIVRHRAIGWTANAMVVWNMPEQQIAQAGPLAARFPGVTLCYQRRAIHGVWPYTLYNMVHARSRDEALAVVQGLQTIPEFIGIAHRVLFSTRCFKQTGALLHRREAAA